MVFNLDYTRVDNRPWTFLGTAFLFSLYRLWVFSPRRGELPLSESPTPASHRPGATPSGATAPAGAAPQSD